MRGTRGCALRRRTDRKGGTARISAPTRPHRSPRGILPHRCHLHQQTHVNITRPHKQQNKPQRPGEPSRTRRLSEDSQTRLTEQEMSLVAAQAVRFAGTRAPVAVLVTRVALPVPVRVLARRALVGRWQTVSVAVQLLIVSAAGAGAGVGPGAGKTRGVAVWE